ncbi:two-component sensor histidine kinase [Geotalea uraniireducens]|uniref:histidine kinase n=1 Tax=Geotalea uraniireducens TaxID=351604 RepID=A0ABM8EHX0_9BACT|nr:ATP-binding protein [Geotalea uraniireducens]BDV42088.1 two-component sensor histidine kinase [Geotalea uraniireducens]
MRTMFVKLFFWFWLAMTLSGTVFFVLAVSMQNGPLAEHRRHIVEERRRMFSEALALYGNNAVAAYERGGDVLAGGTDIRGRHPETWGFLFAGDGRPLTHLNIPPAVSEAVQRAVQKGGGEMTAGNGMLVMTLPVTSSQGKHYIAAAELPGIPAWKKFSPFRRDFVYRLAIYFVVGGVVCYGLAWRLTAPIRRLRAAAQRLAAGDLSARVGAGSKNKGDEIADLGRDFDRMAERIEALLTSQKRLVRDISHELRSPLARLSVALGLARQHAAPAAENSLDRIEREAERLNEMIGEMLTLTLLEGGKEALGKERVELPALVEEVAADGHFEAEGHGRKVVVTRLESLTVLGDRELLRRALENVVRNAVRYTTAGTAVEIALDSDEQQGARIRVRDHGPGVPPGALTSIFRPFYRVADARDRQSGGTGIGLAITERAVSLHGGTVTADNAPDGGLVVEITLPLA